MYHNGLDTVTVYRNRLWYRSDFLRYANVREDDLVMMHTMIPNPSHAHCQLAKSYPYVPNEAAKASCGISVL